MNNPTSSNLVFLATTSLYIAFSLFVAFGSSGCAMNPADGTNNPPVQQAQLELTYVSGHLGNYWDCPDKGGTAGPTAPPTGAPAEMADAAMGACETDENGECIGGGGGGFMNCEEAILAIVVKNVGDVLAKGIEITDLELLDSDKNNLGALQVLSVVRNDNHDLTGELGLDEEMTLIIKFQGPQSNTFGWNFQGHLHLIVVTDDDSSTELVTPALEILPAMAT
jgi:hypothetical protein